MGRRARRIRGFVLGLALVGVAVGTVLFLSAYRRSQMPPQWWAPPNANDTALRADAEKMERGVTSVISQPRPADEPWMVEVDEQTANAWLNMRLPMWIENRGGRWPEAIEAVQVRFLQGRTQLGVGLATEDGLRVVTLDLVPVIDDAGALRVQLLRAGIGRVDVPARVILERLDPVLAELGSDTGWLTAALRGEEPLVHDPVVEADPNRLVRVVAIRTEPGKMLVTSVNEGE